MIDTNNSHIDVAELMKRVRTKAAEFRRMPTRPRLPPVQTVEPLATAILPQPVHAKTEHILQATQAAREATSVSSWIPKPLRGLFRRQDKFNDKVIRALESLAKTNEQLADRVRHLTACAGVQDHGLHHLAELRRMDAEWMNASARLTTTLQNQVAFRSQILSVEQKALALEERLMDLGGDTQRRHDELGAKLADIETRAGGYASGLQKLQDQMEHHARHLGNLQSQTDVRQEEFSAKLAHLETHTGQHADDLNNFRNQAGGHAEHLRNLQDQVDDHGLHLKNLESQTNSQIGGLQNQQRDFGTQLGSAGQHLNNLQKQADDQGAHLRNLQDDTHATRGQLGRQATELETAKARLQEIRQAWVRADERQISEGTFLKSELSLLGRRLADLSSAPAQGRKPAPAPLETNNHELDALYVAFEDQFRGSREFITKRLHPYLTDVSQLKVLTKKTPLLDLGCGRGEWLELLKSQGYASEGVDLNTVFAGLCRERGLQVTEADAIAHLRSLPEASRGAITAFHLIEHLQFPILVELLRESLRVLRPGGLVIFETPNPDNMLVGSNRFYTDPTHLHPLPKEYSVFLLNSVGFTDVVARSLNPDTDSLSKDSASPELRNLLNRLFYGDQDYAVIGRKSAA